MINEDTDKIRIALCYKCTNAIMKCIDGTIATEITGCKLQPKVKEFQTNCPLLKDGK